MHLSKIVKIQVFLALLLVIAVQASESLPEGEDALKRRVELLERLATQQRERIDRFRETLKKKEELLELSTSVIRSRDWSSFSKDELELSLAEQFRRGAMHPDTLREFAYIFRNYLPKDIETLPGNRLFYIKALVKEKVVHEGMTTAKLRDIVGDPEDIKTEDTTTLWNFDLYQDKFQSFMVFKIKEDALKEVYVHHRKDDTTRVIRFPSS